MSRSKTNEPSSSNKIYKTPQNVHSNEKNIYLSIRNEHNEEEREKSYKDLLG